MFASRLSNRSIVLLKAVVFAAALVPFAHLAYAALWTPEVLGPNPAEFITRSMGDWTLRFLLLTLAVTPVRKLIGWHWLVRFRRMLGLYTFFYAVVHFNCYLAFDHVYDVDEIIADVIDRPFITLGFAALLMLVPLAATSTNAMVRRLGGKRWASLHRLVYVIGVLGVIHFWLMVKADVTEPAIYALILAVLLGYRLRAKYTARQTGRLSAAVGGGRL